MNQKVDNLPSAWGAGSERARSPAREGAAPAVRSRARLAFVVCTGGLSALALDAALHHALGPLLALAFALGWFTIATVGVFVPQLEMYARVISRGPSGHSRVALTFDDGPHPVSTRRVLAALAPTRHRATFFVLGEKARRYPELLREIQAGGHTIGLHGDVHDYLHSFRMPWTVRNSLRRAADAVQAATGKRPRFFRPPLGHTSVTSVRGVRAAGVTLVGWSSRGLDGVRRQAPEQVVEHVSRTLDDGAIVLLHDAAENDDFEPATVAALPQLLTLLDARGLTSVSLDTLLA